MSTRSDIIVHRADGSWKRIYCHFDGYLSGVGAILLQHYNSQERADLLVEPGNLSSLAPKCDKPKGHSFETRKKGYCVYYGRDRGDTVVVAGDVGATLEEVWPGKDSWTEYTYVFDDGVWFLADKSDKCKKMDKLGDLLAGSLAT